MKLLTQWSIGHHVLRAWLVEAGDDDVRRQCYALRYQQYHNVKRQIPANPSGLDIDWADAHSTMMCTTLDNDPTPIGTFRYIHAEHGCLLTHGRDGEPEVFSGVPFTIPRVNPRTGEPIRLEETVEGSRCVGLTIPIEFGSGWITRENGLIPGDRIVHSMLLFEASLELAWRMGIKQWVCAIHDKHVENCVRDGWDFIELMRNPDGSPHQYKGEDFRVCLLPIPPPGDKYPCRRFLKRRDMTPHRPSRWSSV